MIIISRIHIKYLILLTYVSCLSSYSLSQTADEIIDKNIEKIGGYEKFNNIYSLTSTGNIYLNDSSITKAKLEIKGKNKLRITLTGKRKENIYIINGNSGWKYTPNNLNSTVLPLDKNELYDFGKNLEWEGSLINYKLKGSTAELIESEDSSFYCIKLVTPDNVVAYYFVDKSSYLIKKIIEYHNTKIIVEKIYIDYITLDGIMFSSQSNVTVTRSGVKTNQYRSEIESIEFNVELDDSIFEKPSH